MKKSSRMSAVLMCAFIVSVTGDLAGDETMTGCVGPTTDTGQVGCLKMQTSLPCLDVSVPPNSEEPGYDGSTKSHCGFKRRWVIFGCSCGRPVASWACTD